MTEFLFTTFILTFLIQLFHFLFPFLRFAIYQPFKRSRIHLGVSVIIAAYNEKKNLERLIPLLLSQTHSDFEIIVADDRSTDGTQEFLRSLRDPRLKIVRIAELHNGFHPKKYALTQAIDHAAKEVLLLTDADCYPASNRWIEEMQRCYSTKTEIVLGYSPYEKREGILNLFIRYETFVTAVHYLSFALIHKPYMGVGRNLSYTKALFKSHQGFGKHAGSTGGDDDLLIGELATATNTVICIDKEAQVCSYPKTSVRAYFRQKIRHMGAGKRYSLKNKILSGMLPMSQILWYFSFIGLIFFNTFILWVLSIFILRTFVLILIFALISRKLGETINWLWFPFLDLLYVINYLATGISVFFSKNIKWT